MKKNMVKNLAGALATFLIFLGIMSYLTQLVNRKDSYYKYQSFYDSQVHFDVLVMGTSHARYSIFPMELMHDYGIRAYNFGGHSNRMATSYWLMMNAFDYTDPNVVVIDCFMIREDGKFREDKNGYSYLHDAMDHIPMSVNKIKMASDLMQDNDRMGEYIWNFSQFHNRWNELGQNDFVPETTTTGGASFYYDVYSPENVQESYAENIIANTTSIDYLRRMIEECQKREIDVLLTYLPFPATQDYWDEANTVQQIAEEYDVRYINYLTEDVVDFQTDCKDDNHLNYSGGQKITAHLGKYIKDNYDIPDRRDEYASWNAEYQEYLAYKKEMLKEQVVIEGLLIGLRDDSFSFVLEVADGAYAKDAKYSALLKNVGIDSDKIAEDTNTLIVVSREAGSTEYYYGSYDEEISTAIGMLHKKQGESGEYEFYLGDTYCWDCEDNYLLRFAVVDTDNKQLFDVVAFSNTKSTEVKRNN